MQIEPISQVDPYPCKADLEAAFRVIHRARVPQVPDLVLALRHELTRGEPDLRRAADLVSQDPALTGQVLKVINSPQFFCPTKISSIQRAVMLLGLERLANLVTAGALSRLLGAGPGAARSIWESARLRAQTALTLAEPVADISADEVYLFSLMQDVGSLIFVDLVPDYGSEWLLRGLATPGALLDYERRVLGTDHTTVGFLIAGAWRLPEHLALAIYQRHRLDYAALVDPRVRTLVAMAQLTQYLLAMREGVQDTSEMLDYREAAASELGLSIADLDVLYESVRQDSAPHGGAP